MQPRTVPPSMHRLDRLLAHPLLALAVLCLAQIVVWTLAPALVHQAPPLDMVEGYLWGREWPIATYKHPALPAWVLEASRVVTGAVGWPGYLVSQLFIAATFGCVFALGRDLMGERRALAGTLLLTGVYYFSWPGPEFNHNIAQMPLWAGLILSLWRAGQAKHPGCWALVGAFGAACLYAKLSGGVLLVVAALWILLDESSRRQLASIGPWLGLAVFAALIAPLMIWLVQTDFQPLHYAADRSSSSRGYGALKFLGMEAAIHAALFVLAAAGGLFGGRLAPQSEPGTALPAVEPRALRFLLVFGLAPGLVTMAAAVLSGNLLRGMWGAPMFSLSGLIVVALTTARFRPATLRRIALGAGVLLLLVPALYIGVVLRGEYRKAPNRGMWPQREISRRLEADWERATGQPLRIVAGDAWVGGLVALTARHRPSLLTDGNLELAPWISAARLKAQGALLVWDPARIPAPLRKQIENCAHQEEQFTWPRPTDAGPIRIGYCVIPPG